MKKGMIELRLNELKSNKTSQFKQYQTIKIQYCIHRLSQSKLNGIDMKQYFTICV